MEALENDHLAMSLIRASKIRVTDARVKVVALFLDEQRALSHQEINDLLGQGSSLEKVTLYRTLSSLVGCGLISRTLSTERAWRFRLNADEMKRSYDAHFYCVQCNSRIKLDDKAVMPKDALVPAGYLCSEIEVTIRGICPECNMGKKISSFIAT